MLSLSVESVGVEKIFEPYYLEEGEVVTRYP